MLASTMQFSSNGRTHQANRAHHNQTHADKQQAGGYTHDPVTRVLQKHSSTLPHGESRPVASGPNSVLGKPPTPDQPRSNQQHPRRRTHAGVLAATPAGRLFVNVPPMSNHPRRVRPGPGLCHQHQPSPHPVKSEDVLRRAGRRPRVSRGLVEMSSLERR